MIYPNDHLPPHVHVWQAFSLLRIPIHVITYKLGVSIRAFSKKATLSNGSMPLIMVK
jgi:hypothetical protein